MACELDSTTNATFVMKARTQVIVTPSERQLAYEKVFAKVACVALLIVASCPSFGQTSNEPAGLKDARGSGEFEVTGLKRVTEGPPQEISVCRDWVLTSDDVKRFFSHAELLDQTTLHHTFDVLPCGYSGWLSAGGLDFHFSINAGGFGVIEITWDSADYILYSCSRGCESLFQGTK